MKLKENQEPMIESYSPWRRLCGFVGKFIKIALGMLVIIIIITVPQLLLPKGLGFVVGLLICGLIAEVVETIRIRINVSKHQ